MVDALIIDACRTPRGIGKTGKGALSVFIRNNWARRYCGHSPIAPGSILPMSTTLSGAPVSQRGPQSGDLGRMSALDAGYDVRASGVTLDRFCGSGITSVNMAASAVMSGSEDLVIAGGYRDDVDGRPPRRGAVHDGRRQSSPARPAPAIASGCLRRCGCDP